MRLKEYIKQKMKSKRFMFGIIVMMLMVITSFSYAIFMISTEKYKASEMYIANLIYGISIESTDENSTVNGKEVTVLEGETAVINVKITSLNPIDSNYKLQYKVISGSGKVYYSNKTNWMPYGTISKSNEVLNEKEVQLIVENTGSGELKVEIGASGGYVYNSVESIGLISGYIGVTEEKEIVVAVITSKKLTEVVEEDTNCTTGTEGNCMYGGESKNNYVQYPESENKSENIWRIMGTYNIEGSVVTKLISETTSTSTYIEAITNLNSFYVVETI